jgi:effector-binding domain-containing protein
MLDTPHITQSATQLSAAIHLVIPRDEIQRVMGPGLSEVMAVIAAQGIKPAGPWFTHHLKMVSDHWDFEICVPVSAPIVAAGRVAPIDRPAMKVARTIYHGSYEGLGSAWGEFLGWIADNGHTPAPDLYECYLTGPDANPDPASWRTELTKPLAG